MLAASPVGPVGPVGPVPPVPPVGPVGPEGPVGPVSPLSPFRQHIKGKLRTAEALGVLLSVLGKASCTRPSDFDFRLRRMAGQNSAGLTAAAAGKRGTKALL